MHSMMEILLVKHRKKKLQTEPESDDSEIKITWDEKTGIVDFKGTSSKTILNIIKIAIIIFVSISLLGNFSPFYFGVDSLVYGLAAVNIANGSWEISNELLQETGSWDFVPDQWVKTEHNTAIPGGALGIYAVSSAFYFIGGYAGLFYLGPIFTILLLIFSERIATKLFGSFVGFVSLVMLSSSIVIFRFGLQLLTDIILTLIFILGCFYLIKFLREKKEKFIFLSSVFFVLCALVRMTGIIFMPIEIFLVVGYFTYYNLRHTKSELNSNNTLVIKKTFSKIATKNFLKITTSLLTPWVVFFLFLLSYNLYTYGDILTDYIAQDPASGQERDSPESFLRFDSERFAWSKFYLAPLLPGQSQSTFQVFATTENHDSLGIGWQSTLSLIILVSALGIALYRKEKRTEIFVFLTFIIGLMLFYSSNYIISIGAIDQRYMLPALPLSLMIFGFVMHSIWKTNFEETSIKTSKTFSKNISLIFLIILIIFLLILFSYSTPVQIFKNLDYNFNFNNPEVFANRYPIDTEGLSESSVILAGQGTKAVEYNAIPYEPWWKCIWEPGSLNSVTCPEEHIQTLTKIMEDGYEVYTYKSMRAEDVDYFKFLKTNYGMILYEHSKTFCKLELKGDDEIKIVTGVSDVKVECALPK